MSTKLLPIVAFVVAALSAWASSPLATVSATEPITLNGRAVSTESLASVPLTMGSELATSDGPALLVFPDGSSVKLAAGSKVKLMGSEALPKLVLMGGSLDYKLVLGSSLSVTSLDLERQRPARRQSIVPAKPVGTPRADAITLIRN